MNDKKCKIFDEKEIKNYIEISANKIKEEEPRLNHNIHERTYVGRLAYYLQIEIEKHKTTTKCKLCKGIYVDVEYNKIINSPKCLGYNDNNGTEDDSYFKKLSNKLKELKKDFNNYKRDNKTVFNLKIIPDIVIHERNKKEKNIAIIEIKKEESKENLKGYDKIKLEAFKKSKKFQYKYAFYFEIKKDCDFDVYEIEERLPNSHPMKRTAT